MPLLQHRQLEQADATQHGLLTIGATDPRQRFMLETIAVTAVAKAIHGWPDRLQITYKASASRDCQDKCGIPLLRRNAFLAPARPIEWPRDCEPETILLLEDQSRQAIGAIRESKEIPEQAQPERRRMNWARNCL